MVKNYQARFPVVTRTRYMIENGMMTRGSELYKSRGIRSNTLNICPGPGNLTTIVVVWIPLIPRGSPFHSELAWKCQNTVKNVAAITDMKSRPSKILVADRLQGHSGSVKRIKSPITANTYTVATLQVATNSFSQENLIGEGFVGRVYKAEFSNGKVTAVKKIDNAALSLQEEDNFK